MRLSLEALPDRESVVPKMIASGKHLNEIAETLCISPKTVSTYRARIIEKTGLQTNGDYRAIGLGGNTDACLQPSIWEFNGERLNMARCAIQRSGRTRGNHLRMSLNFAQAFPGNHRNCGSSNGSHFARLP